MDLLEKYNLKPVINGWGTPTLYGVSQAPEAVQQAVAQALGIMVHMPSLIQVADKELASFSGAESGCITHCTASAITLACAAVMTGGDIEAVRRLPNTDSLKNRIVIGEGHRVNYGHSISQAIALSGATEIVIGEADGCGEGAIKEALANPQTAAMIYVVSHLAKPGMPGLERVIELAREAKVPLIVDAAAQDLRMQELVAIGPDLILFSAQKYLKAPTAGIVLGRKDLVAAVEAQHSGIGRGMKPTKEAIFGVLAALELRNAQDMETWEQERKKNIEALASRIDQIPTLNTQIIPDPTGCPFSRIRISPTQHSALTAMELGKALAAHDPIVATGAHYAAQGFLNLEVHDLSKKECERLVQILRDLVE